MSEATAVEILIVGNEILNGDIQDTNTHWLCKEISSLGGRVSRVTAVRDVVEVVAAEIKAALERGVQLLLTSGGLGPTADDLTLAGVAQGAGVELGRNEEARRMIRECYDRLAAQGVITQGGMNPAREKMALFPAGAVPLANPIGSAPGVLLKNGKSTIVSLPGVPRELKGIFESSLQPLLRQTFRGGTCCIHSLTVRCNDESVMEPVLSRVVKLHPSVYIKSLANNFGAPEIKITLFATGTSLNGLESILQAARTDLQEGLTSLGIAHWESA